MGSRQIRYRSFEHTVGYPPCLVQLSDIGRSSYGRLAWNGCQGSSPGACLGVPRMGRECPVRLAVGLACGPGRRAPGPGIYTNVEVGSSAICFHMLAI